MFVTMLLSLSKHASFMKDIAITWKENHYIRELLENILRFSISSN